MFDIGWTEMLVIAVVMIVVVGPKDLPKMLRTFGRTTAKMRSMAGDFQRQFNEALREAELEDVKKSVESLKSLNPANEIRKQLNPLEKAASEVRAGLDSAMKPAPKPSEPDAARAVEAEPLKGGAAAMPGAMAGPADTAAAPEPPRQEQAPVQPAAAATPAAKPARARGAKRETDAAGRAGATPPAPARKTARKKKLSGTVS